MNMGMNMDVRYKHGKIYKLFSKNTELVYYGSTIKTKERRLDKHKTDYISYLNGNEHYYTSFEVLKYGDYDLEFLEEYPCGNKKALERREGWYQRNFECVNFRIEGRTNKEYYEDNKEQIKQYYEDNKEHITLYKADWYQENKEEISKKLAETVTCEDCGKHLVGSSLSGHKKVCEGDQYRINKIECPYCFNWFVRKSVNPHIDKIHPGESRIVFPKKPTYIPTEKVTCECGVTIQKTNLSSHKKSKQHNRFIKNKK